MIRHVFVFAFVAAPFLCAATNISGTISSATTWDVAGSPFVVSGATVSSGVTLTILPGVVVKMNGAVPLRVNGNLVVNGTASQPVIFTSIKDDSAGGDTNGDGNASSPAAGDWGSIWLRGSTASLNHAIARYGGAPITVLPPSMIDLQTSGSASVTNGTFTDSKTAALYILPGTPVTITGNTFARDVTGIAVLASAATHNHNCSFQLDFSYGVLNANCPSSGHCPVTPDVDAVNNYWGSPSGPWLDPPAGAGDHVSYHVTYIPFLGRPTGTLTEPPAQTLLGRPGSKTSWTGSFSDPINTATGNYYLTKSDVAVPGIGLSVSFDRSYNSQDSYTGPLGAGWTHSYNIFLTEDTTTGNVAIKQTDGRVDFYSPAGGGNYLPQTAGLFDALQRNVDNSFTLTRKNQTQLKFSSVGKLISITDRNGNTQTLNYDGSGNLASVTDSSGRTFNLAYDGGGRIVRLSDTLGRSWQYSYDADGNLVSVRDAGGGVTEYAYDANHRMVSAKDSRGVTFLQNTYDNQGRVITQTNGREFVTTFAYGKKSPSE